MNERAAIRAAAAAAIVAADTVAESRVSTNRLKPLQADPSTHGGGNELPAVLVYTADEKAELFDESPRRYRRELVLRVEAIREVETSSVIDDDVDAFAGEIEQAILRDPTLGNTVHDCTLQSTATTIVDDGARELGAAVLSFVAVYFTVEPEAGQPDDLDDLIEIRTEHSLNDAQASADRAKTIIGELDE